MAEQGDLPRALRFAVSQIQPGSGPTEPMNEQDRAWLNEILGEMAVPHSNQTKSTAERTTSMPETASPKGITLVLRDLVNLIKDEKKPHIVDAVKNELQHIAEDGELLDRADDSDRRNAVAPIAVLLMISCAASANNGAAPEATLRHMVAPLCSILAELAQNSPECQEEALKLIPKLITVIKSEVDPVAKTKAVYALSGILRGNQSTAAAAYLLPNHNDNNKHNNETQVLVDDGAVGILVQLILQTNEAEPVRLKAAFLLSCLAEQRHDVRQLLCRRYEQDMQKLQESNDSIKEQVDQILKRIHTKKTDSCGQPPLALGM